MSTPSDPPDTAADSASDSDFDPYRFGHPDVPPPPEFQPPGYKPPPVDLHKPPDDAAAGSSPHQGPSGYPGPPPTGGPYGQPPHQAYPPYPQQPYQQPYSQGPYGQYPPNPYGQPPYPPYQPGPVGHHGGSRGTSGKAIASMVLGIVSVVFCWTLFFDAIPVVLALIFGIIALNETKSRGQGGRGQAIAGIVCAAVGAVLAITITIVYLHAANDCGGIGNSDDPGFNQCVRDNL